MTEPWTTILSYALEIAVLVLTPLVAWGLTELARRLGVEADRAKKESLGRLSREVMLAVEEWARRKAKLNEPTPSGKDKLARALELATIASKGKLPAGFEMRLEAELAAYRQLQENAR